MEFDGNLSRLQGTLYSLGSQGLLNKQDSFSDVIDAVKEIVQNLPDNVKSKLTFFMVLNTQLPVSEKLKDDEFVCLFINIMPPIEKEYLILYVYHLNLQLHLFKVIENSPEALSLNLLDVIIKKLKEPDFHKDEFGIEHFYQLWQSVFLKICKINVGCQSVDSAEKFILYFEDIYELIQKVLIVTMKISDLEKFVGFHLYYFFTSILYFINVHKNPNVSDDPVYKISSLNKYDQVQVSENIMKICINLIFEKIFKILESLTIDLWMTFTECYFDVDSKNSLQLLIGTVVYDILEELENFEVPSNVLNCLSSLAINKSDLLAKADLDEIVTNVNNGNKEWFKVLVRHSAFKENKSVECLLYNLNMADSEDLNVILNTSYECLSSCEKDGNVDLMKALFLSAVKKTTDYSHWLEKVFTNYQPDLLTTVNTQNEIVETFNKISKENVSQNNLTSLCMQSPFDTVKRICQIAVYGCQQTEFVIEILKLLKPACNMPHFDGFTLLHYALLRIHLEQVTDKEKHSFINFVVRLNKEKLLETSFFYNSLKIIKEYLENENLEKVVLCLEIVRALLNSASYHVDAAAFLIFMSQVLEHLSWDLGSFLTVRATGRDLVIRIVTFIMRRLNEVDGSDFQWARREILKAWEVNQACFCDLWFSFGHVWQGHGKIHSCILALVHSHRKTDDLRKFLSGFDKPFEIKASIVLSLTVLLPVLTFREWNSIFSHLIIILENTNSGKGDVDVYYDILDMFGSSLYVLTSKLNENNEIFSCYQFCLRNFARLAKSYCPKLNGESAFRIFEKFGLILKLIEDDEKRKSCWNILSPLWLELNVVEASKDAIKELLPLSEDVEDLVIESPNTKYINRRG